MTALTLGRAGGLALLVTLAACATSGAPRAHGTPVRRDAVTRTPARGPSSTRPPAESNATTAVLFARPQVVQRTRETGDGLVRQRLAASAARAPRGPVQPWRLPDVTAPRDWQAIVIHHSGTVAGNAAQFDTRHREVNGWDGLGYQFVIGNGRGAGDGEIEIGFRWWNQREGAHAGNTHYNEHGIGICLVGNFHTRSGAPTAAQWASLVKLVRDLQRRFAIPTREIRGHHEVRDAARGRTECPGEYFPWARLMTDLAR